jgi:cyanophycin synthetase
MNDFSPLADAATAGAGQLAARRIKARLAWRKGLALLKRAARGGRRPVEPVFAAHARNNEMVKASAARLGIRVEQLPAEVLMLEYGGERVFSQGAGFENESMISHILCADKELAAIVLKRAGIPVPPSQVFSKGQFAEAWRFLQSLPATGVVKPCRDTWGGRGVTVGVDTLRELENAFVDALVWCPDVIVEAYVAGDNYRFNVYEGEVLSVNVLLRASVTGDGSATIRELVERRNDRIVGISDFEGQFVKIAINSETRRMLRREGLSESSVPAAGKRVALKGVANVSQGGYLALVNDRVHPELMKLAVNAAAAAKSTLCGVDIIAADIEKPLAESGAVVNEVNTTPGLFGSEQELVDTIIRQLFDSLSR